MAEHKEKHLLQVLFFSPNSDDWKAAVPHLSEFGPVEASDRFGGGVIGRFGRHHDERELYKMRTQRGSCAVEEILRW